MKKVLVITYYWPPSGGAGVQRWLKFVKYLREFGWEPVVYTPENPESPDTDHSLFNDVPSNLTVIKRPILEPYTAYKKFHGQKKEEKIQAGFLSEKKKNPFLENISVWIRGNFFIPDARMWWIHPSVKFLKEYLKENPVDAIVSTGPPHSMHLIALGVKRSFDIPWLADFRDPWTNIDFYDKLKLTFLADWRHRSLERKVLKEADAVTTVSWSWADDFRAIYSRKYEVVTNGYDPDDFPEAGEITDPAFSLTHIGSLNKDRNPEFLWKVISELCSEDPDFRKDLKLRFIGKNDVSLDESLQRNGLSVMAEKVSYMPHAEVLSESSSSRVLLLLLNNTPHVKGIIPGKIFEYLATRRPVLCIGPVNGDSARIIQESGAGITCDFGDEAGVKSALKELYRKFKSGELKKQTGKIENFSRRLLASEIAQILNNIAGGK